MYEYTHITNKLDQFIKKYYTQTLLKGVILFFALGLLLFLFILGVEYLLWLGTTARMLLFGLFIIAEVFLLFKYILTPLFYLLKLKDGISSKYAADAIGKHFPEVGDKLTNLLDLAENKKESELLLASINQRSKQLEPIPFTNAIDLKEALKYLKYSLVPLSIILIVWLSGSWNSFFSTYDRVVNYELAYEKPAPFRFEVLTPTLNVLENNPITIQVRTKGIIKPKNVFIDIDGKTILLQKEAGLYQYTFNPPISSTSFRFKANDVISKDYELTALATPAILDFNIKLKYPSYLKKKSETINSTGNAVLPEGTKIVWQVNGENINEIKIVSDGKTLKFEKDKTKFSFHKTIYKDYAYTLSTSNKNIKNYENLSYNFKVIKDAYPTIKVVKTLDSLNPNVAYYSGNASDDYGVKEIEIVYADANNPKSEKRISLTKPNSNFKKFYYTFPSGLELEPGKKYNYYFEVTDNDAIHKGKRTKSQVFQNTLLDETQLKNKDLEDQHNLIKDLDKSLQKAKDQKETLQEINKMQKENRSLNFNDQSQIKDFLQKQEKQEQLMQKFSKELKKNLEKGDKDDKLNQLLQERLERQEKQAKKNEKLLEELNKIADKINKEELSTKLEEVAKKQKNSKRSLEQLLELTKRYYVTEKAAQLASDLKKLAKRQEQLSTENKTEKETKEQKELNEEFNKISKELDILKKDNNALKKPIDLKVDKNKKQGIKEDQEKALEELKKQQKEQKEKSAKENAASTAGKKQKSAAQKMKEMSEQLGESSSGGSGGDSPAEDAEMLRQILDNLIIFSFKQESLYDKLNIRQAQDANQYSETVRSQKELKGLFEHVDDSLFTLSLRQAELSEFVNEQITEVYYNIDKTLETMADGQMYQSVSYQKYVLTAANSLADFLANVMDNMQESMKPGSGEGESQEGFQLPDIIKGQKELGEKMGEQGEQGEQGKEGESGQKGDKGKGGKEGAEGENGKEGEGQSGKGGQGGNGKSGKGKNGKNGEGQEGGDQNGKNGDAKKGTGKGKNGSGGQEPNGMSESELKEIYEIYQEQQTIRQELEKQLQNMINTGDRKLGEKLVRQMEDFENDLLENGITQRTITKANTIQYELLKLENAALKQGKKSERKSNANKKDFTNPILSKPSLLENYRNEVEILNRQALPLRQNYKDKVKAYFKGND